MDLSMCLMIEVSPPWPPIFHMVNVLCGNLHPPDCESLHPSPWTVRVHSYPFNSYPDCIFYNFTKYILWPSVLFSSFMDSCVFVLFPLILRPPFVGCHLAPLPSPRCIWNIMTRSCLSLLTYSNKSLTYKFMNQPLHPLHQSLRYISCAALRHNQVPLSFVVQRCIFTCLRTSAV